MDLADPGLYLNRELSWIEFDRRVLAQATEPDIPLLERLRFVAIFADNLDEFFMVRVAGLNDLLAAGTSAVSHDGLTPAEQLEAIAVRLRPLLRTAGEVLHDQLLPLLGRQGVSLTSTSALDATARDGLVEFFEREVFPVLTPLAVDPGHPFPYISNLSLSLAVRLRDPEADRLHFARVKVPGVLARFVAVPGRPGTWVPLEQVIAANLPRLFPGMQVVASHPFRVTRDADLDVQEDEAEDLLLAVEAELSRRRFGSVTRLEVAADMPAETVATLREELDVDATHTYEVEGLMGLGDLHQLAGLDLPDLHWEPWHPAPHPRLLPADEGGGVPAAEVFAAVREGDVLVRHPYQSFTTTVERFVTAAADDPDVLAIKQTLYRTSGDSPIVKALIRAAEDGKQVVALVELKARFDEERNIAWARVLEKAGVHVVYGLVGLKTHCKTSLVVRRDPDGIRRYVHVGSGNYNPTTARLYTDVGLLSCRPPLGEDLTLLFNYLTGYARQDLYSELLVAPASLRERCAALIARERDRGGDGVIRLKLNALIDQPLIAALYEASRAGTRIDLVIRGICGLRPGIPGVSDRIRVTSIVGRLLEHERIMQFGEDVWIGSADWMPRNLDRRVEAMVPVTDPTLRHELRRVLDLSFADNQRGWALRPDGSWVRRYPADGEDPLSSQEQFMAEAAARAERALRSRSGTPLPGSPHPGG